MSHSSNLLSPPRDVAGGFVESFLSLGSRDSDPTAGLTETLKPNEGRSQRCAREQAEKQLPSERVTAPQFCDHEFSEHSAVSGPELRGGDAKSAAVVDEVVTKETVHWLFSEERNSDKADAEFQRAALHPTRIGFASDSTAVASASQQSSLSNVGTPRRSNVWGLANFLSESFHSKSNESENFSLRIPWRSGEKNSALLPMRRCLTEDAAVQTVSLVQTTSNSTQTDAVEDLERVLWTTTRCREMESFDATKTLTWDSQRMRHIRLSSSHTIAITEPLTAASRKFSEGPPYAMGSFGLERGVIYVEFRMDLALMNPSRLFFLGMASRDFADTSMKVPLVSSFFYRSDGALTSGVHDGTGFNYGTPLHNGAVMTLCLELHESRGAIKFAVDGQIQKASFLLACEGMQEALFPVVVFPNGSADACTIRRPGKNPFL